MAVFLRPHILSVSSSFLGEWSRGYCEPTIVLSALWIILFYSQGALSEKELFHFADEEAESYRIYGSCSDLHIVSGLIDSRV